MMQVRDPQFQIDTVARLVPAPDADSSLPVRRMPRLPKSLMLLAAEARSLSKTLAALSKARSDFLNELQAVTALTTTFSQARPLGLGAILPKRSEANGVTADIVITRLRRLQQTGIVHLARESSLRQSCARIQEVVDKCLSDFGAATLLGEASEARCAR